MSNHKLLYLISLADGRGARSAQPTAADVDAGAVILTGEAIRQTIVTAAGE